MTVINILKLWKTALSAGQARVQGFVITRFIARICIDNWLPGTAALARMHISAWLTLISKSVINDSNNKYYRAARVRGER
jgi:hypothetical protein